MKQKILLLFLFCFGFTIVLASFVIEGEKGSPNEVAKAFLTAMNKADYEAAKKLGTDDTKKLLDMTATFAAMMPDSIKKLSAAKKVETIGEPKIEGDKATVSYKESDSPEQKSLSLVKKEGKWLVQQSKDNETSTVPEIKESASFSSDLEDQDWIYVGSSIENNKFYIKSTRIYSNNSFDKIIKVWSKEVSPKIVYVKNGKKLIINGFKLSLYEYNCSTRQSKFLKSATYSNKNVLIDSHNVESYNQVWEDVIPDTIGEMLLDKACELF
jgi:hypothetical protein